MQPTNAICEPEASRAAAGPNGTAFGERLERWSRTNAIGLLATQGLSGAIGNSLPIAAFAFLSFILLVATCRREWTPTTSFGWANSVTAGRLALVLLLACALGNAQNALIGGVVVVILLLDLADGWLARRLGTSSSFGAHFDMETDALLVVVVTQVLWQKGTLGSWILISGWLRYVNVLFNALIPGRAMPRFAFGRVAFASLGIGLFLAFVSPPPIGAAAALVGTVMVSVSFARSFYFTWVTRH